MLLDLFAENKETRRTLEKTVKEKQKQDRQIEDLKERERAREREVRRQKMIWRNCAKSRPVKMI